MKIMFGSGKVYPTQKKAKRQHSTAYYVIGMFTFAIEAMLGINAAFLVDQSMTIVAHNIFASTFLEPLAPIITLIISLLFGAALMAGGIWTFSGFMETLQDVRAYAQVYHLKRWPVALVWAMMIGIIAIDFTTLAFRASFFSERGAIALFVFFVILIFMPSILGALVYILENTPRDRRLTKARQYGEQLETDDTYQVIETMDPDLRSRYLSDDPTALQEHYARVDQQRQEAWEYEQQQIRERDQVDRPLLTITVPKLFQPKKHLTALPHQAQQDGQDQNRRA